MRHGRSLGLQCTNTDKGAPRCIIYDRRYRRIVLQIARIDQPYVVVFPLEGRSGWTVAAIDLAMTQIEFDSRRAVTPRCAQRACSGCNSNVGHLESAAKRK